jgi:hypothetical protein
MEWPRRKKHVATTAGPEPSSFDLDVPGSRFSMSLAAAIGLGPEWMEKSESKKDLARTAIAAGMGESWLEGDPELVKPKVLDGSIGRGASGWIPVLEWLGEHAVDGFIGFAAGEAARVSIRRIRERLQEATASGHRPMVSRGLAAALAMEHVFETTDETQVLHVEFAQEPSFLGGRPPTEPSYTGLEPWIVSLVNGSRRIRYVLVVAPDGDIRGCITSPAGEFDYMFGLLPPTE